MSRISSVISAILGGPAALLNRSNIATYIPKLSLMQPISASSYGRSATNTVITFACTMDLEADFDQVAIIYGNSSNANSMDITRVSLGVGPSAADLKMDSAFAAPIFATFGGAGNKSIPAASQLMVNNNNYFPTLAVSDFMPLPSVARTDIVGGRPLLYIRTEVTPVADATLVTSATYQGTDKSYNTGNADIFGRYYMSSFQASPVGKAVGALGGSSLTNGWYNPVIGVRYRLKSGNIVTVLANGDSITRALGVASQGTSWVEKAVQNINNTNSTNINLKSPKPVSYMNMGWDTTIPASWTFAFNSLLSAGLIPTVAILPTSTPNLGSTDLNHIPAYKASCTANKIYPMVWGGIPGNYALAADTSRLANNATMAADTTVKYLNFNAVVSDFATPERLQASLAFDAQHPNNAGDTAMSNVLQPVLNTLVNGYYP